MNKNNHVIWLKKTHTLLFINTILDSSNDELKIADCLERLVEQLFQTLALTVIQQDPFRRLRFKHRTIQAIRQADTHGRRR